MWSRSTLKEALGCFDSSIEYDTINLEIDSVGLNPTLTLRSFVTFSASATKSSGISKPSKQAEL